MAMKLSLLRFGLLRDPPRAPDLEPRGRLRCRKDVSLLYFTLVEALSVGRGLNVFGHPITSPVHCDRNSHRVIDNGILG